MWDDAVVSRSHRECRLDEIRSGTYSRSPATDRIGAFGGQPAAVAPSAGAWASHDRAGVRPLASAGLFEMLRLGLRRAPCVRAACLRRGGPRAVVAGGGLASAGAVAGVGGLSRAIDAPAGIHQRTTDRHGRGLRQRRLSRHRAGIPRPVDCGGYHAIGFPRLPCLGDRRSASCGAVAASPSVIRSLLRPLLRRGRACGCVRKAAESRRFQDSAVGDSGRLPLSPFLVLAMKRPTE